MVRWRVGGILFFYMAGGGCIGRDSFSVSMGEQVSASLTLIIHKKQKTVKHKKHKKNKKHPYSVEHIEKVLENNNKENSCNRLNCASKLQVAKSCLKTKASHRTKKECFHAFCSYGCNEEDYKNKRDVRDFCNRICSSKKFLKK
jgi:hypothetical protein